MNHKCIVKICKDLGCCDACCLRYLGLRSPSAYENPHQFIHKYLDTESEFQDSKVKVKPEDQHVKLESNAVTIGSDQIHTNQHENVRDRQGQDPSHRQACEKGSEGKHDEEEDADVPPPKRVRLDNVCVSCLGVLQEETWPESFSLVQEELDKKKYECDSIACALSSPIAAIMRERAISLQLQEACPDYDLNGVMPLKEAWKWSFGRQLATRVAKRLDSGAVAPLLVTLSLEYAEDAQELEALKALAPALFEARSKQRRRFAVDVTRRAAEQALAGATLARLRALAAWSRGPPPAPGPARPSAAAAQHAPAHLGGRYVKLCRELPQTPWLVAGRRMLDSSVQELIVEPVAAVYGLTVEEGAQRVKFIAAGREDVDVRCLGTGRPFALEIADPRRRPDHAELLRACSEINAGGKVLVKSLVPVTREDLAQLKKGEEFKCKTYEALCIKLEHGDVTAQDIDKMNAYRNTAGDCPARVQLLQRTPVRVLHRRPLLARPRRIYALSARPVPRHAALFVLRLRTEAGTYVKEWAHGELRRTRPSLEHALGARADILALDVADVELAWPPRPRTPDTSTH